jgi:DNA polymerase-3 subunit chi
VLFLVGGAAPPEWDGDFANMLARIVLMFDGRDGDALAVARAAWKDAKAANHDVTYWKESPSGKFEKQA